MYCCLSLGMIMIVSAGILLLRNVNSAPEILLLRSAEGSCWGPPKGHLEDSENGIEAAVRETFEETGLTLDQINIINGFQEVITYQSRSMRLKNVVFYLGIVHDSNVKIDLSSEHDDYIWTSLSNALQLVKLEILRPLLCDAFTYYMQNTRSKSVLSCESM